MTDINSSESSKNCPGDGSCLIQCCCECSETEKDICGHREHNGYCPSSCCAPQECRNFQYCGLRVPQWVLNCHNGMCMGCAIQLGPHKLTNKVEECCVCLEDTRMIKLKCGHNICNDCWCKISTNSRSLCPLCRNLNNWSKTL